MIDKILVEEKLKKYNIKVIDAIKNNSLLGTFALIHSNPEKGFNFGYVLYFPNEINKETTLFVEGMNTGHCANDIEAGNIEALEFGTGFHSHADYMVRKYKMPLLRPLFPRCHSNEKSLYTHALTGETYFTSDEIFKRIDIQLIKMIEDAKEKLNLLDIIVDDKIIIEGFSASAKFANRFTILHPDKVKLCIAGGVSGFLTLPLKEIDNISLPFPVGLCDIDYFDEEHFNEFKNVKQFYYMGSEDKNDTLETIEKNGEVLPRFPECFNMKEIELISRVFGKDMIERWTNTMKIYKSLGINAEFITYEGYDHTPRPALTDIENSIQL